MRVLHICSYCQTSNPILDKKNYIILNVTSSNQINITTTNSDSFNESVHIPCLSFYLHVFPCIHSLNSCSCFSYILVVLRFIIIPLTDVLNKRNQFPPTPIVDASLQPKKPSTYIYLKALII